MKTWIAIFVGVTLLSACGGDSPTPNSEVTETKPAISPLWSKLAGSYEIVGIRRASETAAPADLGNTDDPRGEMITIGEGAVRLSGASCDDWSITEESGPDVMDSDPMLHDLRLPVLDSDVPQSGSVYSIDCEGESVFLIYQADPRALAVWWDNGASYLVAEKPLDASQIQKFQEQLADMKFQPGPVSDTWTESGLIGLRSYYSYRARNDDDFVFNRPVITASLLEKLGVIEE